MNNNTPTESQNNYRDPNEYSVEPPVQQAPPPQRMVRLPNNKPFVVYLIMGITILAYLLQIGSEMRVGYEDISFFGMKINELIYAGEYWRLITPVFLHGSLMHIAFNMYALYALGPQLERFYGSWQFLLLYLTCGFGGVVASFVFTTAPSVGASTAIFGLLGAHGIFAYLNQKTFGERAKRSLRSVVQIAAINLLIGFTPGIDNWGHFGGLVAGAIVGWFGGPVFKIAEDELSLRAKNSRTNDQFLLAIFITLALFGTTTAYLLFTNG